MNQKKLLNKKIIISAAADGIGWSIAQACMSNGAIVYVSDKNKDALDKISKHNLFEKQLFLDKVNTNDFQEVENYYVKMNEEHIRPKTKATAIQIGKPANLLKGLRALEFTDGVVTTVTDNEMLDGMSIVGLNGFDCEMASGAVPAGIKKLLNENVIKKDDRIIGILTGRQKEPLLPINYHNEPTNQFARPPKR